MALTTKKKGEKREPRKPKLEVRAYHGSGTVFEEFDTGYIGTGEGATAFGWGLYFSSIENIGRHYAETTSRLLDIYIDNKKMIITHPEADENEILRDTLASLRGRGFKSIDEAIKWLERIEPIGKFLKFLLVM